MKKYRVNVNGTVYEVELEEITGGAAAAPRCRCCTCRYACRSCFRPCRR